MSNLSILRNNWDAHDGNDVSPREVTTIQECLDQWVGLQVAFEWQLQQTATLFEQDRWAALIVLQARLQSLSNPLIRCRNCFSLSGRFNVGFSNTVFPLSSLEA